MIDALNKFIAPLKRRVLSMIGKAIILAADDSTDLQTLKIEIMKDEIMDAVERLQNFGFTSVPEDGAEAIVLHVGGDRSNAIVIAVDDSEYRLKGLEKGEAAIYNSNGDYVKLKKDKIIVSGSTIEIGGTPLTVLDGVVTGACLCSFTGVVHPDKSSKVRAAK